MKTVGITGGTGLVGSYLAPLLMKSGYAVVIFTRKRPSANATPHLRYALWNPEAQQCDITALAQLDAIVHLAGAGIADKRWTAKRKKEIADSRIGGTEWLVSLLQQFAPLCKTFVAASAIGYYGASETGAAPFKETDAPASNFLGNTCVQWEAASQKADAFARTVILRFGIVLSHSGGAFREFAKPLTFGIRPILGTGRQVISWIEAEDLARLILWMLERERISVIYNAVSPHPATQRELMNTIANAKRGVSVRAPVPGWLLRTVLGEMSGELLNSCHVSCEKILSEGFLFNNPEIADAVKATLKLSF